MEEESAGDEPVALKAIKQEDDQPAGKILKITNDSLSDAVALVYYLTHHLFRALDMHTRCLFH